MSKPYYVESSPEEATAILCEHPECETYYLGEAAQQHIEKNPGHLYEWLKLETV